MPLSTSLTVHRGLYVSKAFSGSSLQQKRGLPKQPSCRLPVLAVVQQDQSPLQRAGLLAALVASSAALTLSPPALAVSGGGGLANDLNFQDFTGQDLSNKQYYKVQMRNAVFHNANMRNTTFFGSFCKNADFSGADLSFTDLESVDFDGADFTDAVLEGAQVAGAQFRNLKSIDNTDWTDVVLRKDQLVTLCKIAKGTNPKTGVDTRESLMCS